MATTANSKTTRPIAQPATEGKSIVFDRTTKDYACYLDGDYIGHRANYSDAENTLNSLMMERLHDERRCATDLDSGASVEAAERDEAAPIGTIHGISVYGAYYDEPGESCHGQLYKGSLEWNGKTITVYDDDRAFNLRPVGRTHNQGDIHLDDWQWLKALAQTDVVEQLTALVRGLCGVEPPAAAPAPTIPPAALIALQHELASPAHSWDRTPVEVGRTVAGVPIMASFDVDGVPWIVEAETEHWSLNAGDDGSLNLLCKASSDDMEFSVNEGGIAALRALPQLLAGDTPERLIALARLWGALDPDRLITLAHQWEARDPELQTA